METVLLANCVPIHQMISSLVFCDTKTDPDPERELAAAKKGLTDGILSVSRVQVRTSAGPKEAYANEHGASLLELVDEMRTQIKTLEQQVMEQREKMTVLEGEGMTQKEKITVLWHLKDSAVAIRKRFFAVYSYKLKPGQISKDPVIKEGNQVAHDGDVITDICLMENGLMDDKETFTALYGLKWERAKELSGMQIYFYPYGSL